MPIAQLMAEGVLYNCSARIERNKDGELTTMGNCTEQGLLKFLMEVGIDANSIIKRKEG